MSQEALAEKAGAAMRYLSGIERGEENPSLRILIAIAEALNVHPSRLFQDDADQREAEGDRPVDR